MTIMSATQVILHVHVTWSGHTRQITWQSPDNHVTITWQSQPSDGNMRLHMTFNMTVLYMYLYCAGIHYSTGHMFDMKTITEAAHKKVNSTSKPTLNFSLSLFLLLFCHSHFSSSYPLLSSPTSSPSLLTIIVSLHLNYHRLPPS